MSNANEVLVQVGSLLSAWPFTVMLVQELPRISPRAIDPLMIFGSLASWRMVMTGRSGMP